MNYKAVHDALIERAKHRHLDGYVETHHILPKCMGGGNEPSNLVRLTADEHFVVHQILAKLHPEVPGLVYAFAAMRMTNDGSRATRKLYGWMKKRLAVEMRTRKKGVPKPAYVIAAMRAVTVGKPLSPEHRAKISAANKGRRNTPEQIAKVTAALKGRPGTRLGMTNSPEHRAKQRQSALQRTYTDEQREKLRHTNDALTPEQRSARAHKAWETKRRKAAEATVLESITTTE